MIDVKATSLKARTGMPTTTRCPVCDSPRDAGHFQARDPHYGNPGRWSIRRCADCGSFALDPMPTDDELLGMYPDDSYYAYRIQPDRPGRTRLKRLVGAAPGTREPEFDVPGRVLDFGCGAGDFLLRMQAAGWTCAGVEVSDAALEVARSHGLRVEKGLAAYPSGSFDYVRANHSLEHVARPREALDEMYRVLAPGGTLFLGVPTNESQNARLFGEHWWYLGAPVHPVTFSTRGLLALLRAAGFEPVRVSTNSDFGSTAGSLQIYLNRHTTRRSSEGVVFALKPLLLLGHWVARLQDACGVGDKLEIVARKPA
ncbi:MAG TPA: class I SAM-dependent methyltransferase [Gemmatimonadales bacterium]